MKTLIKKQKTEKIAHELKELIMAADAPATTTENMVRRLFELQRQIKFRQREEEALKDQLKQCLDYKEHAFGRFVALKVHVGETYIPSYTRAAYDSIKVRKI